MKENSDLSPCVCVTSLAVGHFIYASWCRLCPDIRVTLIISDNTWNAFRDTSLCIMTLPETSRSPWRCVTRCLLLPCIDTLVDCIFPMFIVPVWLASPVIPTCCRSRSVILDHFVVQITVTQIIGLFYLPYIRMYMYKDTCMLFLIGWIQALCVRCQASVTFDI